MSTAETFEIPLAAAEAYEARFVPAIFAEWAPRVLAAADVQPGDEVLDVACGTGVVARTAAEVVGASGRVVGVDLNDAMLTVARRVRPDLAWHRASVDELPFADDSFDATVCQMALMFFPDRDAAFRQMVRVTRPTGRLGVVVPAGLDDQPGYGQLVDIVARHAGEEARPLLSTYWRCGDLDELTAAMTAAGASVDDARSVTGTARFASATDLVVTEVEGSPLAERIDDATYDAIKHAAATEMAAHDTADGRFEIPLVCHVVGAAAT